jgi:hypothetical protein
VQPATPIGLVESFRARTGLSETGGVHVDGARPPQAPKSPRPAPSYGVWCAKSCADVSPFAPCLHHWGRQPEASAGGEQTGALVAWVGAGQPVEGAGVVRVGQVRDLMDEHRIEDPLERGAQPVRDANLA